MAELREEKKVYLTAEQKQMLCEFVESHPDLASGKFTKDFTKKKAESLWKEVGEALNGVPGAVKEWKDWRKVRMTYKSLLFPIYIKTLEQC